MNGHYAQPLADASQPARRALAVRLLGDAAKMGDAPSDRYVVLNGAYTAGVEAGDLAVCLRAADRLADDYLVDATAMKVAAATKVVAGGRLPGIAARNLRAVLALIDELTDAQAYGDARTLAVKWGPAAAQDGLVRPALARKLSDLDAIRAREIKAVKALETLNAAPDDRPANSTAGSYLCLFANQWERGLPLLAKGSDAALKGLAGREAQAGRDLPSIDAVAGDWWSYGERQAGVGRANVRGHAAALYRRALPGLTGIARNEALARLGACADGASPRVVDLLDLVDPAADAVAGTWALGGGYLTCDSAAPARIEFPYLPGEEYDLSMTFRRLRGKDSIEMICAGGGKQFIWAMGGFGNHVCGIGLIDGRGQKDNATARRADAWLANNVSYNSVVRVRRDSIETEVNGKVIARWVGDYNSIRLGDWALRRGDTVGVMCFDGSALIESMDLIDRGGGKALRPRAGARPPESPASSRAPDAGDRPGPAAQPPRAATARGAGGTPVVVSGTWKVEGGDLVQSSSDPDARVIFGDPRWSRYDVRFKALVTSGDEGVMLVFGYKDPETFRFFHLGGHGDKYHNTSVQTGGKFSFEHNAWREGSLGRGRWHDVRVEVRDAEASCYLDDVLLFRKSEPDFASGAVGLRTQSTAARFRDILVTTEDGKTPLWKGNPPVRGTESVRVEPR